MTVADKLEQQRTAHDGPAIPGIETIGQDNGTLRVLNFSGGGFASVMQLGVTHALLVNQGRPPDVVVGVSAGAIQATALAETLRADVLPDGDISSEKYEDILGKRVEQFRKFSDACFNAPKSIVDSVVPDAYQIDSLEPLAAMRLPRLSKDERDERENWISRKTGLVRLYNDLLSIDLPFGAIARIVRRGLGIASASAIASKLKRRVVQFVEAMRLWLVLGTELRRLAPVLPIAMRPLTGGAEKIRHSTAGSIIFRFRPIENLWRFVTWLWSFALVLNFWVIVSWIVALLPFFIPRLFGDIDERPVYLYIFYFLYLLPIILPLTPVAMAYDRTKLRTAMRDLSKGLFAFLFYLFKWTIVLVLLMLGTVLVLQLLLSVLMLTNLPLTGGGKTPLLSVDLYVIFIVIGISIFLVIVRPAIWVVSAFTSFRRDRKNKRLGFGRWYLRRFLDSYGIGSALAENYNLKRMLVGLFDRGYYGDPPFDKVLSDSMKDIETEGFVPPLKPQRKTLAMYRARRSTRDRPIIVALTATDVGSGSMVVLPESSSVVDGMLASTAATPLFPSIRIGDRVLIDAFEVGNDPTGALVELFQEHELADVEDVHIYPVDPLPVSSEELGPLPGFTEKPIENLLDIVGRALQLQKHRDATLDRMLTQVLSDTLPKGEGTVTVPHNGDDRKYFRARFAPIELEHARHVNRKVLFGNKDERRETIGRTIASGCRASLEVMHRQVIRDLYAKKLRGHRLKKKSTRIESLPQFLKCQDVIDEVRSRRESECANVRLPGSRDDAPGIAEICKYCEICGNKDKRVHKDAVKSLSINIAVKKGPSSTDTKATPHKPIPDWPHELAPEVIKPQRPGNVAVVSSTENKNPDMDYPSIACLFSGGVFRGVFQMGVLNALSLLEASPRIVAGASVGSITAAMVATALSRQNKDERSLLIARLASAYVGIDRIILTDRFSDFVRNWTIRASEAKFSLRQVDKVFRKYDETRGKAFQRDFRQVLAGLERLFYVNPYQVNAITRAVRSRSGIGASELMKQSVQAWLDRMEVGEEVLGAEPIQLLIEEFVVPAEHDADPSAAPFDCIDDDLTFLATATNLTKGKLEILPLAHVDTTLTEGLLASSAFPGVFRPRRSWDLHPGTEEMDQFIDGGVMDNLPLEPVLDTMRHMADSGKLPLRSRHGPHLMLAASLEVDPRGISREELEGMVNYWPELRSRAKELKYNTKLDKFERVAAGMQSIHYGANVMRMPMRVKVLAIKPQWLCSTFAFHPMLGFRRLKQIRSIAHGCAATLLAFGGETDHIAGWQLDKDAVPSVDNFDDALALLDEKNDRKKDKADKIYKGRCWLAEDIKCPFSRKKLDHVGGSTLDSHTKDWLSRIHRSCWERQTHVRQ